MMLYEKAFPLFLEALENTKKTLGKEHSDYGNRLISLAGLYSSIRLYEEALPLYLEALENIEKTLGKEHSSYGACLNNLAGLYKNLGLYEKALPLLVNANKNTLTQIKQNFSFQNEEGKEKFVENILGSGLNQFQQFNFSTNNSFPESLSLATNNILIGKGLLLNASKNILTKLEGLNDKNINEKMVLFKSKKAFVNQQLQIPVNKRTQNYTTEKEDLETLERELVTLYTKHFNEEINYVKDWQKTQLKENEIAIEFTHFDHYNKQWTDSKMYAAYLYKKDWKTPKVVNLFEEKQLTKYFSISSNPNNLYKTRGTITKSTTAQLALADSIYKLVWKPLEKYVNSSSTIYFSPDGLLHKIPFAALPNKDNKLICEVYDIQQMGNTADVSINTKQPNLNDVLLIGGVKYEYKIDSSKKKKEFTTSVLESEELLGKKENRSISRNGFEYLEGTELEINKIDSLLGTSKQLSGYEATETAFKKLSGNSPSVLHIATHGFFFKKPKEKPKQNELLEQKNSYKLHENPLLRSGLLFANANYAWQNGNNPYEEDDGILTALEISNLDLKNTDIVILSACETGLGDIEGSEGVYGLQRAFKMAGVKTIIMSLWPVPDAETAEFMNLFYTKWKSYNNAKKAFKETQQQMMTKYRDEPQKWAAFVYFE
jgi:CHAT domain-containing protein